jgi:tetratricopeptide (TPR) repeat protein
VHIARNQLGIENLQTQEMMRGLIGVYFKQERYSEARDLGQEVLSVSNNPSIVKDMLNLAQIYSKIGRTEEVLALADDSVEVAKKAWAPIGGHYIS